MVAHVQQKAVPRPFLFLFLFILVRPKLPKQLQHHGFGLHLAFGLCGDVRDRSNQDDRSFTPRRILDALHMSHVRPASCHRHREHHLPDLGVQSIDEVEVVDPEELPQRVDRRPCRPAAPNHQPGLAANLLSDAGKGPLKAVSDSYTVGVGADVPPGARPRVEPDEIVLIAPMTRASSLNASTSAMQLTL